VSASGDAPAAPSGVPRVDFYVLKGADTDRLRFACRLAEKAWLRGGRVLLLLEDPTELATLDELLWTFSDRSFVPHEVAQGVEPVESPVVLATSRVPGPDILVNLASGVPQDLAGFERVLEIIDADPARREAGRRRFKAYRELGLEPVSHDIGSDPVAPG
jgi:DNA polymerase III subunit chi